MRDNGSSKPIRIEKIWIENILTSHFAVRKRHGAGEARSANWLSVSLLKGNHRENCWICVFRDDDFSFPRLTFFHRVQNGAMCREKEKSEADFMGIDSIETSIESLGLRWKLLKCFEKNTIHSWPLDSFLSLTLFYFRSNSMLWCWRFMFFSLRMQSIRIILIDSLLICLFCPHRKRSLTAQHIPFDAEDLLVLIVNSNVKHELSSSEYPVRRKQCSEALELMGLKSYREANLSHLRGEFGRE